MSQSQEFIPKVVELTYEQRDQIHAKINELHDVCNSLGVTFREHAYGRGDHVIEIIPLSES